MKRFIRCLLIYIIAMLSGNTYAQTSLQEESSTLSSSCSNDIMLNRLRKDPAYVQREAQMNATILNAGRNSTDTIITVPVVVHIIDENPFGITDGQVIAGIQQLNYAYSKSGPYAASVGADTRITFCLAKKSPEGGITNGITRTTSFFGSDLNMDTEDGKLKNLVGWDPLRYVNIWLVKGIHGEAYADFRCGSWFRLGVGGYATLPPGGGSSDGIVIAGFGVLPHEMGHYLGLYHTFEGGCTNFNCATQGDRVCDTPPDNSVRASFSCASPENSCQTDTLSSYSNGFFPADVPDQIANFMDYSNGGCTNQLTQGQADRMRNVINTIRTGLLQDECTAPCADVITASFTRDISYPLPGDLITFTNTSTGASGYEWLIDNVVVATTTNFSSTFAAIGSSVVMLKAFNTPGCFASMTDKIIVTCGVTARFYTNKQSIASLLNVYEDSIVFTNISQNAQTYQWLISNDQGMAEQVVSTDSNLVYVFPTPGNYLIRLIATSGTCSDTTAAYMVPVDDPTADGAPIRMTVQCYNQNKIKVSFCIANYGYAPIPAGTPVNFYDANPSTPGAHLLSPTLFLPFRAPGGNCYVCYTHILNVAYFNVDRVYLVINDSALSIPVVLPNTPLVEQSYFNNTASSFSNRTTVNASICAGQSYTGHTVAGTYVDTLASTVNGCDSIRTLHLTVKPVYNIVLNASVCQGQSMAGYNSTGTYTDHFFAANGCDSTRTLNLTVLPLAAGVVDTAICQGENYAGHTTTGTYIDHFTAANGCDSARTLHLIVKSNSSSDVIQSVCQGQSYGGHNTTGTFVDILTAANGCDSIRTLHLTVRPVKFTDINASICQGQSFEGYTTTGTYVDVFTGVNGCDSTRTLHLTVKQPVFTTMSASTCQGSTYAGYTTSGTYTDVFTGSNGCDSTRTLHLTVLPIYFTTVDTTLCEGSSYAGHTTTGTYINHFASMNGCDSTRTLHLTVNPKKITNIDTAICIGERYFAQGNWQTTTGTYYDTASTWLGCDSVIITNLTVNPLPSPNLGDDVYLCEQDVLTLDPGSFTTYLWQDGNHDPVYPATTAGDYSVMVTNQFGCRASDSMKIIRVIPLPRNFMQGDSTLCLGNTLRLSVSGYFGYLWSTGDITSYLDVRSSGTYYLLVKNGYGCTGKDSVKVTFNSCITIQIPTAFTPDANGKNDFFKPLIPAPLNNYHMQIFNRNGQLLFETNDYLKGWDGKYRSADQPIGTYIYLITFLGSDNSYVNRKGSFILIR